MADRRRGLTAEERLATLRRDQVRLRKKRMLREIEGPRWHRMVRLVPTFFERQGVLTAWQSRGERSAIIEALREAAVFALDTAMRLAHDHGFLAGEDIHAYLCSPAPLEDLAKSGLIDAMPYPDTLVVRPWPGPSRLLACIVEELPPARLVEGGYRVVTEERLRQELIGAVGARADLFALLERAEGWSNVPA
jgi:hypothetical protein